MKDIFKFSVQDFGVPENIESGDGIVAAPDYSNTAAVSSIAQSMLNGEYIDAIWCGSSRNLIIQFKSGCRICIGGNWTAEIDTLQDYLQCVRQSQ